MLAQSHRDVWKEAPLATKPTNVTTVTRVPRMHGRTDAIATGMEGGRGTA